ncbi:hypothetical protein AZE42_09261 [Rhizopogon vesiculosus]|uniref:FAD-binding domain-containing protein n=1 Tax=Rhizopogon vesiculosus TaxID=180088 RepID=A0A1J8QYD8_9AGAM|nr:hypothetical protein AZE42_09261 [Rhizopogon vesiculosus]
MVVASPQENIIIPQLSSSNSNLNTSGTIKNVIFSHHTDPNPSTVNFTLSKPQQDMHYNHPPVLIVGAGPVGLVAALTLLRNGIPVRIIDKDPNHRIGQRAPGIQPRSLELYNFLDVPEINELANPFPLLRSFTTGTKEPSELQRMFPVIEPTPAIPFFTSKVLGQDLLELSLRRHLEKYSCFVETGTELRSFKQSDEEVTAVLVKKQGEDEILETFTTKWMVGADGAKGVRTWLKRSDVNEIEDKFIGVVRKQLGLTFQGETRDDFRVVTGDIRLTCAGLNRVHWQQFGSMADRSVSLRPTDEVGEDGWQFVILGADYDIEKIAQSQQLIFDIIASLVDMDITFNKLIWATDYRANIRMVNKFSEGRVFVADAAHPIGGQGLNSGVQDAFNLCWKLALVEKGLAHKSLLETYNSERLPIISDMLKVTTSIMSHALKTGGMERWNNSALCMLGIHCRFSDIVLDEFVTPVEGKPINPYRALDDTELEAGDRAPEAPKMLHVYPGKSDVMTLFNLYRPWYHTILVFAPTPASATPILAALERYKTVVQSGVILPSSAPVTPFTSAANFVLVDQEGHAYSAYLVEASQTKVFVVRPDGVIGAIVHGAEGVKKYFSRILREM